MSYCRFSDDDYQCDVYCYEDVLGGFTAHVAGSRPILDVELPPRVEYSPATAAAWWDRYKAVQAWLERAETQPIGLPFDGETFNDPDADSAADRLQWLWEMGYNVPQRAIEALRNE
jgi:hypothetical protein